MKNEERIESLEMAANLINEAMDHIRSAVEGTEEEASAEAYILSHLSNWANGNNPYDDTIPKLVENLQKMDDDELDSRFEGEKMAALDEKVTR